MFLANTPLKRGPEARFSRHAYNPGMAIDPVAVLPPCQATSRIAAACGWLLLVPAVASAQLAGYRLDPVHTRVMFEISHDGYSQAIGTVSGSSGQIAFDPQDWSRARLSVEVPLQRLDMGDPGWTHAVTGHRFLDVAEYPLAKFVSERVEPLADEAAASLDPGASTAADAAATATATATAAREVPPVQAGQSAIAAQAVVQAQDAQPAATAAPATAPAAGQLQTGAGDSDTGAPRRARVCGQLELHGVTRPLCLDVTFNKLRHYPLPPFRTTAGFSATATLRRSDFGIDAWQSLVGDEVRLRIEAEAVRDGDALEAFDANRPPAEDLAAPDRNPDAPLPPDERRPAP